MRLRTKAIAFIVAVLGSTALLQRCNRPLPTVKGPAEISYRDRGNTIVVKQKDKTPIVTYQPDPNSTVITTDEKGNVVVKIRQFGIGFEPGLGIGYSNRMRLALDARLVYYKRFGFHSGLGLSLDADDYKSRTKLLDLVDPYFGFSYVPFLKFSNTSLVASYTVGKHIFVFARWRV